ncbi:MAG: penicillin acylase family protein [Chitinophagales bacterium]|nr:penicillin acylase family protein [Chitinophagales bacterium]MDW8418644.1 penicillin acylase family protein [Chitinophagales bacterium]
MKSLKFLLLLLITFGLIYLLNTKQGKIPPFGKFLNPFTGFWQNAENHRFSDGVCRLPGLRDEATVVYDERLVPHIFAKNDEDLYYLQGYITARHRLFQMEISTYAAAGRLTEIAGEAALDNDRLMRRTGMVYAAEKAYEFIEQDTLSRNLILAYCRGVNEHIRSLSPKDYPIEYKLLDFAPEEWKPIKVALLLKHMANMLAVFDYDIENTNFITRYGTELFQKLYPEFIADEDPIIPKGTVWNFTPVRDTANSLPHTSGTESAARTTTISYTHCQNPGNSTQYFTGYIPSSWQKPDEITGSNNWAVSGSKTATGKPILCNDPHLRLTLPSIWYEMHLVSPGMNVYGATLPGAPAVISGFNDSIAWGVTNAGRDVRDYARVSKEQYNRASVRKEIYKIRGGKEFTEEVRYTEFGPVVFDDNYGSDPGKKFLAMRWTAHLPSNEFKTFYLLNRGKNYNDYLQALNYFTCPAQNFVFASHDGDIAIKQQGRFPIMTKRNAFIQNEQEAIPWKTFIPYEHNPHIKNPARGFVSSANQHPTDLTYPYYYPGVGQYENYRNRRINRLLSQAEKTDAAAMMKLQNDNYNLHASEALPVLLTLLDTASLTPSQLNILHTLQQWNYYNDPHQTAPVYFEIWWQTLRNLLWDETQQQPQPMKQPSFYVTVSLLRSDSTMPFYDNLQTPARETRKDIVNMSFRAIEDSIKSPYFTEVSELSSTEKTYIKKDKSVKDWGSYKATKISHLIPGLDAFSALNVYCGGNRGIVNATSTTAGPSWRMIVDFGEKKAHVIIPGGQSGNPGSRFYDNGVNVWARGEYFIAHTSNDLQKLSSVKLFSVTYQPK